MSRRLLVSCFPGHGHLNPLLPVALASRAAGWEVLVSTGPETVEVAVRHGLAAVATGLSLADTERAFLATHSEVRTLTPAERVRAVLPGMFVDVAARSRVSGLAALTLSWRPDVVLHDVLEFAAPLAALANGVPHVAHGVGILTPAAEWFGALEPAFDRLYAEHGVDDGLARVQATTYLDLCPPSLHTPAVSPFATVRPVRPVAASGGTLPDGLDDLPHERTVHVTMGTVVNTAPGLLETLVEGAGREPVNVVVTVGPDRDPEGLLPQPPNVLVERYLPHARLLPRCSAVVAHAGAGTLLATLAVGVPSVLVPVGSEQVLNAELATAAGVALTVAPAAATAQRVREALHDLLHEPSFSARARSISSEIAAMPAPADVLDVLEHVAGRPATPARETVGS